MALALGRDVRLLDYVTSTSVPSGWSVSGDVTAVDTAQHSRSGADESYYRLKFNKADAGSQVSIEKDVSLHRRGQIELMVCTPDDCQLRVSLLDENDDELIGVTVEKGDFWNTWADPDTNQTDGINATIGTNGTESTETIEHWCFQPRLSIYFDGSTARALLWNEYPPACDTSAALAYTGQPSKVRIATIGTATGAGYVTSILAYSPDVIFLGDSIMSGHLVALRESPSTWDHYQETPYQTANLLGDTFGVHRAIGGNMSTHLNSRIQADALDFDPKVVVIMYGVAAGFLGESAATIASNVDAAITQAKAAGAYVCLCEGTTGSPGGLNTLLNALADDVVHMAATGSTLDPGANRIDTVHTSLAGDQALAAVIAPVVSHILSEHFDTESVGGLYTDGGNPRLRAG